MYNEEIKRKFLEWYQKDYVARARHKKWLNGIEVFEREFCKDLSEFNEEEVLACIESRVSSEGELL